MMMMISSVDAIELRAQRGEEMLGYEERAWIEERYREVSVTVLGVLTGSVLFGGLAVVGGVLGKSELVGCVEYWLSAVVIELVLVTVGVSMWVGRRRMLKGVIGVDRESHVVFRAGLELDGHEVMACQDVLAAWTKGSWGTRLSEKLAGRFPGVKLPSGWFGELVWVTFRRDGTVKATSSEVSRVVRGVGRSGWVDCSLVGPPPVWEEYVEPGLSATLGLVEHELAHVPLCRMFPTMTDDAQHLMMASFDVH
jgi:hypothetical protein